MLAERFLSVFIYAFESISFSSFTSWGSQQPILDILPIEHKNHVAGPVFSPPNGPDDFVCDYSAMGDQWLSCSTPADRGCWLTSANDEYNITTNYENRTPTGITRRYTLDADHMLLKGDGYHNPYGKVFNQSYPGPWIKACWGDDIEITVTNNLKYNGTTVHWHGIRQLHTMAEDGVNGVTQCPITGFPTPDSHTYRFKALQYGSSWYHSHYSLQYSDGMAGPLTIFGPSSAPYDEAIDPILMADNLHASAFQLFHREIVPQEPDGTVNQIPEMANILLNGIGLSNCTQEEKDNNVCEDQFSRYNVTFERGKRYLLRLINTSTDNTFIWAIDNHNVTVVGADFVPIKPYVTDSVLVGIGQRYHVIVEANPIDDDRPVSQQNYWMRTVPADGCANFENKPNVTTGIVFYNDSDSSVLPTTSQGGFPTACSDEPYESLVPVVPWRVGKPANQQESSTFLLGLDPAPSDEKNGLPPPGNFQRWELGDQPLYINFSDPTILHVDQQRQTTDWAPNAVVVPQNVPDDKWVYLLVTANALPFVDPPANRTFFPLAHPLHLHGHDFAILAQSSTPYWPGFADIKLDNPPRRDVALLPAGGFLLLAFKADNPGSWVMHCHIAWHASSGLALQILEQDGRVNLSTGTKDEANRLCNNWDTWYSNTSNWYETDTFQEDSGI